MVEYDKIEKKMLCEGLAAYVLLTLAHGWLQYNYKSKYAL